MEVSDEETVALLPTKRLLADASSTFFDNTDDDDARERIWSEQRKKRLGLWSISTISVPLSYFVVGLVQNAYVTPLRYYLVETRGIETTRMSVLGPIQSLPWCFKVFFGVISDCYPMRGERRRPYFVLGWLGYFTVAVVTARLVDQVAFPMLILLLFLQHSFFVMSDVASDSLLVERSRVIEEEDDVGSMQSTCYVLRFTGSVIGAVFGAAVQDVGAHFFSATIGMSDIYYFLALASLAPLVSAYYLEETAAAPNSRGVMTEIQTIIATLSRQAVYRPMFFIAVYNFMQWSNPGWYNFLIKRLHFTEAQIGFMGVVASMVTFCGVSAYRRFWMHVGWQTVYLWTTIFTVFFAMLQLLLIVGYNRVLGIPDIWFSLGDYAIAEFVRAVQFLPTMNMYISMCPPGGEGSMFAILTTMSNLSGVCGSNFSELLAYLWPWDITNAAFTSGDVTGFFLLSLLTALANPLPLLLINLLPSSVHEQEELKKRGVVSRSKGLLMFGVVVTALVWIVLQNAYVVLV
ncbi:Folate-biopterin transporter 1 [Diplonema papillatum]|nr:Folate-biopterin transporter 1 [Diplonema papillatum]